MKKWALMLLLLLCACVQAEEEKGYVGKLHAIIITDIFDDTIGFDVTHDLVSLRKEARKISKMTRLELNSLYFYGDNLKAGNIVEKLQSIVMGPNDAVLFYFSGHGYRTASKKSPWPDLLLSEEGISLDYKMLIEILAQKDPRFILAIADCCNNVIPQSWANTYQAQPRAFSRLRVSEAANYRHLFLDSKGLIMISGSSVGQYSWSVQEGGVYTLSFLNALHEAARTQEKESIEWDAILKETSLQVMDWCLFKRNLEEPPQEGADEKLYDIQMPYHIELSDVKELLVI